MIETRYGNALDVETGIIVHGCNCQGIMGAGIALEIKNRFPQAFEKYLELKSIRGLKLGEISMATVDNYKFIVNANTQEGFGRQGRQVSYDAIADCFTKVVDLAKNIEHNLLVKLDIIFPMIGAGLGGGDWKVIQAIIDAVIPDEYNKILYVFKKE